MKNLGGKKIEHIKYTKNCSTCKFAKNTCTNKESPNYQKVLIIGDGCNYHQATIIV